MALKLLDPTGHAPGSDAAQIAENNRKLEQLLRGMSGPANLNDVLTWDGDSWEPAVGGAGGGAPTTAQYVTMALDAGLSAERVLTAGTGLTLTDGGANGNATLAVTPSYANALMLMGG